MSYAALVTAWNLSSASSGALPSGVTGTSLFGLSTANKITAINGWTVSKPIPAMLNVDDVINAIVPADLISLTATQIALMQLLFQGAGTINASPGTAVRNVFVQLFASKTTTLNNLTALVAPFDNNTAQWVFDNGYGTQINIVDVTNAGVS